jgi:hypothetical protein
MQSVTSNAVAEVSNNTIKIQSFTENINIQPNDDTNVHFNLSSVSGYTPIFITTIHPSVNNNNAVTVQGFWIENDTATISIGNRGSIVLSGSLTIKIGYIKNIFI